MKRSGFTLIELLVVIAIIAVLSVVVVLSLNPSELLRQSRDANRLSDLSTLNSALALYTTDQAGIAGFSLGNASSVYVSLPDSSSTCGTWNLPTLPAGYTYACSTSTSSKNINTTGWIPVNFSNISGGAPFSNLPLDNVNQSSTGLYYTYYSNGSQFIVTAIPESQKQKAALGTKSIIQNYPEVLANGSNMTISPLFNTSGLVGYWNFDEGSGSSATDLSGSNNTGNISGTTSYTSGKVGASALSFCGGYATICYVSVPSSSSLQMSSALSVSAWIQTNSATTYQGIAGKTQTIWSNVSFSTRIDGADGDYSFVTSANGSAVDDLYTNATVPDTKWHLVTFIWNGSNKYIYVDGLAKTSNSWSGPLYANSQPLGLGVYDWNSKYGLNGLIDDVRIYNRALSPAEIQALYNAEK